ncbi:MAG: signal peptidase I [Coriobacteriia bacterium]
MIAVPSSEWTFIPFRAKDRTLLVPAILLLALLSTILVVFFGLNTPITVDGDSMYPTLHTTDKLLVQKSYPTPRRGDIVSAHVIDKGQPAEVIKRVIGLPGDTIEIVGDNAIINGSPESGEYDVLTDPANTEYRTLPFVVPDGHVFLLGDNRPVSEDSRFFGAVPLTDIEGRAVAIYAPIHRIRLIDPSASGP